MAKAKAKLKATISIKLSNKVIQPGETFTTIQKNKEFLVNNGYAEFVEDITDGDNKESDEGGKADDEK